ncbi:hypothetical protein A2U01_0062339, partial [Trifolium medium]|nr:hypothetical protein [Trifolium medium]
MLCNKEMDQRFEIRFLQFGFVQRSRTGSVVMKEKEAVVIGCCDGGG